ncbi:hypothetical protein [Streptomyces chattanoogensis]|uniref:hypothetical protein n=1 Tax=Streptomyces chattanoogensis TaxID=66876 RepID=UPI0005DA5977|nr:hypothetical protein T261_5868 [Streptomyces lydicus]
MSRMHCRRGVTRAASLSVVVAAALLAPAAAAMAQESPLAAPSAAAAHGATKPVTIDIGAGTSVVLKGGKLYYAGKALKPGQIINDGIYLYLSADGQRLYSKTQGGGTPYAIWNAKTGKSLGTQKNSPTAAKASLTAKASTASVRAWQKFTITGKATGIKAGSKVTLQQKQRGVWKSLPAAAPVNKSGSYSLWAKLGLKGTNELRMVAGTTYSPVFKVTVR